MGYKCKEQFIYGVWLESISTCFRNKSKSTFKLTNKPSAIENTTISETFARHLNTIYSGRRAFIQAETSDRIRRALSHKIRASGECYQSGDKVYYKRDDDNRWKGPRKVIGQDGKVVFVRHSSVYVRVHPCRLIRCNNEFIEEENMKENSDSKRLYLR